MKKQNESEIINVLGLMKTYMSKWYYFVISVILCCGLAFGYIKLTKPVYQINANVLISQDEDAGGMASMGGLSGLFGSSGYVEDEVFVVSSHSVFKDVVRDLGLYKNRIEKRNLLMKDFKYKKFPIEIYSEEGIADTLRTSIKFKISVDKNGFASVDVKAEKKTIAEVEHAKFPLKINTKFGKFTLLQTKDYKHGENLCMDITFMGYDVAAENLAKEVTVGIASKKSNVIALNIQTPDIEYGKDLLNEIVTKYNERGVEEKSLKGRRTSKFLTERIALLEADLESSEAIIEEYKRNNGIVDVSSEASYQLSKKGVLEDKLLRAETDFEIIKITREFVSNPDNAYSMIATSPGSMSVQSAITAYNQMILKRMELERNAKGENVALQALTRQIDASRENIIESLKNAYETAKQTLNDFRAEMSQVSGRLDKIPKQEREYLSLRRQQEIKQQLYLFLLKQLEESELMIANSVPKGIIVDEAFSLNEPVGMSKKVVLLLAFVIGLVLPIVFMYFSKLLRTKFETKEELEKLTVVPVLGEICTDKSGNALVVKEKGASVVSELFRLVRTNLQFIMSGKDDKVVLMTSTVSGEGKSFVSINLASSLAMLGKKVLLVGMDIRNPKLSEYLSIAAPHGLTEYLSSDTVQLSDIIIKEPTQANLDIITAGPIPPNPAELLLLDRVDELFVQLRRLYDYIIVDSAPVGMVSDSFTLARISDVTVYICRANYTSMKDVNFINNLYEENRLKKMALVVNGTTAQKGYGYGYGYGYNRK